MVYVIQEVVAASEIFPELSCPHCRVNGKVEISILRTDVKVGLIPMLSGKKRGESMCHHCGLPVKLKEGGEAFKRAYLALKAKTRTPLYLWSGMIFCCLGLFGTFAYTAYEDHNNPWMQKIDPAMLSAPKAGDIYEVGVGNMITDKNSSTLINSDYALVKVEKIDGDLVTLRYRKNIITRKEPPLFKELANIPGDFDGKAVDVQTNWLKHKELFLPGGGTAGTIYATKRP